MLTSYYPTLGLTEGLSQEERYLLKAADRGLWKVFQKLLFHEQCVRFKNMREGDEKSMHEINGMVSFFDAVQRERDSDG